MKSRRPGQHPRACSPASAWPPATRWPAAGGLPAMLNPNGYWDTMPDRPRTELVRPGGSSLVKPID
ncbi:MAG: hypothetical protein FJ102_10870 [Deltaproteobacteria bacterium]|nr:hypothetical protein [Deltaproteobacteria bacterium]